jgi:hypothetical protein
LGHENDPTTRDIRAEKTADFLGFLSDETRHMFDEFVSRPCGVSIKLLRPSDEGRPTIQTYMRDSKSRFERDRTYRDENPYPLEDHSPFVDILTAESGLDYYMNNDLTVAAEAGAYRNSHAGWAKFYNATLIVPIQNPSEPARDDLLGFLCIDTLRGEFDDTTCLYMARIVANNVFIAVLELSILGLPKATLGADRPTESGRSANAH